jgi:hypothetical protein
MSNKWKFFWVVSFALVLFFQACGSHSWEELLVSTTDEKKMGREFDSLVRNGGPNDVMQAGEKLFKPNGDVAKQELYDFYLARGKEMVRLIDSKDMNALLPSEKLCRNDPDNRGQAVTCTKDNFFEFKIIESSQMNAFAVPGGYVYFYTTILKGSKGFQSESELMSVMGHEIGHVVLHHSRDRMVKQAGANALIQIFLGDGIAGLIGLLGANFWLTSNGQEDESASDSMGFYYTNKMRISSQGLSDFFKRGLVMNADGSCNERANSSVMDVFSTHPPSCERVNNNKRRMDAIHQNHLMDPHTSPSGKTFKQLVSAAGI